MIPHTSRRPVFRKSGRSMSINERKSLYLERFRLFVFSAVCTIYFVMLYFGAESFLPSQENDANNIANMSISVNEVDSFDGYAAMAYIYSITNDYLRYIILSVVSVCFIYFMVKWCRNIISLLLASALCISPILLFLGFFVKDTFYLPFMMAALLVLTNVRRTLWATILSAIPITIYAVVFRQYFLIVVSIFLFLTFFRKAGIAIRVIVVLLIPLVLMAVPNEVFIALQEPRDIVNHYRIGFTGSGTRTAFLNYMRPDDLYSFLVNYGYAVLRLNFPIFFGGVGPKELFLMASIFIYAGITWIALRHTDSRVWRPALLFSAHFLTLMLFEPDLGSYLRHIGTSLPLLAPALGAVALAPRSRQLNTNSRRPVRHVVAHRGQMPLKS